MVHCVLSTVASEGESTEATMLYIVKEVLRNRTPGSHFYTMDGAGCHMHPSVCRSFECIEFSMYIQLPNGTAFCTRV